MEDSAGWEECKIIPQIYRWKDEVCGSVADTFGVEPRYTGVAEGLCTDGAEDRYTVGAGGRYTAADRQFVLHLETVI